MKKYMTLLSFGFLLISLNGCIMIQSVSISDVQPSSGTEVSGTSRGLGFLRLTAPTGLAEKTAQELRNKGAVGNISTVLTMREWFGIVQVYKVTATGTTLSR